MISNEQRDEMIKSLASELPKYCYNAREFIPGKTPVFYSGPYWDNKEIEAALKTFLTGRWLVSGENVAKFQIKFGRMFNAKHCHMVNSGSSANLALISALKKRLGWKDGDEVIVSPVGFPTTIAPLVQCGLKPVFVDIEWVTLNFDLNQIEDKITKRTVAIFVSPVLGNPPDLDYLYAFADQRGITLIGDNCDSLGSKWNGKPCSDYYYAWSTSFYPAHHISTGEGGMVCSNDEELINQARSISWWGRDCRCVGSANLLACGTCGNRFDKWLGEDQGVVDHKYLFTNMGYNLKPLDLQGSIGLAQLEKFPKIDEKRRENYHRWKFLLLQYATLFRVVGRLDGRADPCWFGVPIVSTYDDPEMKTKFVQFLEDNKIQTRNYFAGNILLHPGYSHLDDASKYPNANEVLKRVFFVGCPPHYTDAVFDYIESVLKKWSDQNGNR